MQQGWLAAVDAGDRMLARAAAAAAAAAAAPAVRQLKRV
jgi:hypothetical protein